jgi:hypothetical protein
MANERIFYALQQVEVGDGDTSSETMTALKGVQSVGMSSTTNVESVSAFGSIEATTILQDMDLEITVENALGSDWTNALSAGGYSTFDSTFFDTKRTVTLHYLTDTGVTKLIKLDAILTAYSVQLGTDGPATESITFQNAGASVFTTGSDGTALPTQSASVCNVITRPNFTRFTKTTYPECCESTTNAPVNMNKVQSFSASFDVGSEKISALGQSQPLHKFATFPAEISTEVEVHVDPSTSIGLLNSGSINASTLAMDDVCHDIAIVMPGNWYDMAKMRLSSVSRSGGDVGGGNVAISQSFTGFNTFSYQTS